MNDRFQRLAEQALQLVADEHTNGDESRLNTDSHHVKILIQEKFGWLLIKECCDRIEHEYKYVLGEKSQWAMSQDVQALLLEHFEIEQDGEP